MVPSMDDVRAKAKQAVFLCFNGFREACCLHRVVFFCLRSKKLLIRTGQCFLLNGLIFLGRYNDIAKYAFVAMGRERPLTEPSSQKELSQNSAHVDKSAGLGGVMIGIGEQVFSVLLLSFFFLEVFAAGFIPYIGKALNSYFFLGCMPIIVSNTNGILLNWVWTKG